MILTGWSGPQLQAPALPLAVTVSAERVQWSGIPNALVNSAPWRSTRQILCVEVLGRLGQKSSCCGFRCIAASRVAQARSGRTTTSASRLAGGAPRKPRDGRLLIRRPRTPLQRDRVAGETGPGFTGGPGFAPDTHRRVAEDAEGATRRVLGNCWFHSSVPASPLLRSPSSPALCALRALRASAVNGNPRSGIADF